MPQIGSPVRRVLADKSTNASVNAKSPVKAKALFGQDAVPRSFSPSKTFTHTRNPSIASPKIGQKRKIEEVDDPTVNDSQNSTSTQRLSQHSRLFSDISSEREGPSFLSDPRTTSTAMTSFHASQEGPGPIEYEFEIREEMSQQTLDKMHAVSLPPYASQLLPPLRPNFAKETSQLSVSMSSLIDFQSDSSQGEGQIEVVEEVEMSEESRIKDLEKARKALLDEKAEMLRTRLRLAFYKVQTNQVAKPFSRLNLPKARSSSPRLPAQRLSSSPRTFSSKGSTTPKNMTSPETRVAMERAKATMQRKPGVRPLNTLPIPKIVPTAFSARWNESSESTTATNIPSSPPPSHGHESALHHRGYGQTPSPEPVSKTFKNLPRTPIQLSSPPRSPHGQSSDATIKVRSSGSEKENENNQLTSSVVKGEAASGLLELMRSSSGSLRSSDGISMRGV